MLLKFTAMWQLQNRTPVKTPQPHLPLQTPNAQTCVIANIAAVAYLQN